MWPTIFPASGRISSPIRMSWSTGVAHGRRETGVEFAAALPELPHRTENGNTPGNVPLFAQGS